MKIITLCLATVFAGLAAVPALAAEGKLNFIGKVVNASCKLEGVSDSGVIDVSMGAIPLSRLKNSQSGTGPAVGIDIRVKDCEKGTYYIVVDGPSPADTPENRVLALDEGHVEARQFARMVQEILEFRYKDIYNP